MYPFTSSSVTAARTLAHRAAVACALGAAALCAVTATQPAFAGLGAAPMSTPAGATVSTLSPASAAAAAAAQVAGASSSSSSVARQAVEGAASSSSSSSSSAYSVQQTTLANGTVVREYLATDGSVFGVAWNGQQMPDLSALLGSYFPQYVAGVKASRAAGRVRGPGVVEQSGLVVHSGGHMGAFSGQAWLPQALPAGVSASDIQ